MLVSVAVSSSIYPHPRLKDSESGTGGSRVANVLEYVLNGGFTVADIILHWGVSCQGIILITSFFVDSLRDTFAFLYSHTCV